MFNLMTANRCNHNLFQYLDDIEKSVWSELRTDVKEEEGHYLLKTDLPGFEKDDIQLEIKDDILIISAKHQEEVEKKEENYVRRERRTGSFKRSFDVSDINTSAIEASYRNGVLELILPKSEAKEPEALKIEIK